MSVEGVWTAEAHGAFGWENRGIFFFENGRTLGGDNRMYCSGTYETSGDKFEADWLVQYFGPPRTLFGETVETITLKVTGTLKDDVINAILRRPDRPGFDLDYRLTRRGDVPKT